MADRRESESGELGTMRSFEEYRAKVFPKRLIVAGLIRTIFRRWGRPLPIVLSRGRERSLRWLPAGAGLWRDPDEWLCWAGRAGRRGVGNSRVLGSPRRVSLSGGGLALARGRLQMPPGDGSGPGCMCWIGAT